MTLETIQILGTAASVYGLGGALSVLLQARQMYVRGTSCDVSARFLGVYVGGFAIWLLYGIGIESGLVCGTITLAVLLWLRRTTVAVANRSAGDDRAASSKEARGQWKTSARPQPCT